MHLRSATVPLALPLPIPAHRPGRGWLEVNRVNRASVVTRALAHSPLRLLAPRGCRSRAAWVYTSTFGGGLVAGDQIDLSLRIGAGCMCALTTQASTKVYGSQYGIPARQFLNVDVEPDAMLAILPDPLTCFAGAEFEQRIRIDLAETSSLVLIDWLTSGRRARGERWAFNRYRSRIDVNVGGQLKFRDALLLDEADEPITAEHRMGRCDCFGAVLLLGNMVQDACAKILAWAAAQPIARGNGLIFSASPIAGGAVLRVAGPQTEEVGRWIRQRLDFIPELLGGDPWARKW